MRCIQAKVFRQDRGVRVDFDHIKISHSSSEVILFIKYRDQFPPDRTQAFQNDAVGRVIGLKTSCQFHHLLQAGFLFQLVDSRSPDGSVDGDCGFDQGDEEGVSAFEVGFPRRNSLEQVIIEIDPGQQFPVSSPLDLA